MEKQDFEQDPRWGKAHAKAASLLLYWAEHTGGSYFGHDHKCPHSSFPPLGPWASEAGDPATCTCGWSAFRIAYTDWKIVEAEQHGASE